jgi:hypothetical protein
MNIPVNIVKTQPEPKEKPLRVKDMPRGAVWRSAADGAAIPTEPGSQVCCRDTYDQVVILSLHGEARCCTASSGRGDVGRPDAYVHEVLGRITSITVEVEPIQIPS